MPSSQSNSRCSKALRNGVSCDALAAAMVAIGAKLRLARLLRNRSLADVSEMTGVPISFLSEIERGISTAPPFLTIARIAQALTIPLDELTKDLEIL